MKMFMETDTGERIEIKEIKDVNNKSSVLIFFTKSRLPYDYIEKLEWDLSNKTGRKCVVLDSNYSETIYGI